MRKKILIYLLLGAIVAPGAVCMAQDAEVTPPHSGPPRSVVEVLPKMKVTNEGVLRAIALFRQDPVEARDKGAVALIMQFAEESAAVHLEVGPKVVPFMEDKSDTKYAPLLLAAFVAGDVRAQLEGHNSKDDPMAGALQVIDTYQFLRRQDASVHFASVEEWITLQKQGKLRGYLEQK